MAKKPISKMPAAKATKAEPKGAKAKISTPVRNTALPKASPLITKPKAAPTYDQIAKRAFELYASGVPGSESDHWFAAEHELRDGV
jgi:hypothetical protein